VVRRRIVKATWRTPSPVARPSGPLLKPIEATRLLGHPHIGALQRHVPWSPAEPNAGCAIAPQAATGPEPPPLILVYDASTDVL